MNKIKYSPLGLDLAVNILYIINLMEPHGLMARRLILVQFIEVRILVGLPY